MAPTASFRVSLGARMAVALLFVGGIALSVVTIAVLVTGLVLLVLLLSVAVTFGLFFGPLIEGTPLMSLWPPSRTTMTGIVLVGGGVLSYRFYAEPVRNEIRAFEAELGMTGTLADDRHPKIARIARRLAQRADISEPEVRIVNRSRPESYALVTRDGGTIVVSRGVIRQLEDDEIEAVLAHEVSHLANRDSQVLQWLLVPMLVAEHLGSGRPADSTGKTDGESGTVYQTGTPVGAYLVLVLGTKFVQFVTYVQLVLCQLGVAVLSRDREIAADRGAAELTGSPSALASALQTLDDTRTRPTEDKRNFRRTGGVLDILPVENEQLIDGPFRTHPTTETRVDRLESLVTEIET